MGKGWPLFLIEFILKKILKAKDSELNNWASLKKAIQFRPIKDELSDVRSYKDRSKNIEKKKKILESVFNEEEKEDEEKEEEKVVEITKKKKKKKKVKKEEEAPSLAIVVDNKQVKVYKKKKTKKNVLETLTDERLEAYGINPKKFHKKLKYSSK